MGMGPLMGMARILLILLLTTEITTLPEDLGSGRPGVDWPDFLGPGRTSKSSETGLHLDWTQRPQIAWQCILGTSYGAPAVSRGRLLHYDRHGDLARLTCRHSETGQELWRYEHATQYTDLLGYNNGPRCSPIVEGNRVYAFSAEGEFHCVRLSNGKPLWQINTQEKFGVVKNFFGVGSTPLLWDDLLIANIGGSPPQGPANIYAAQGNILGNGSGVVAFDKMTGEIRWQATDEFASYASPVSATLNGKPWCFVFARGGLVGLNPGTGAVGFSFPWRAKKLESGNASSPVVVGNRVFISETYGRGRGLLEMQQGAAKVVWQDKTDSRDKTLELHWNTAVHHDGYLYGSSGRHTSSAELRCVDLETGQIMWSEPGFGRASLLFVENNLICLSEDGTLRILEATSDRYKLRSEIILRDAAGQPLLEYPAWAAPILSHGLLYVRGKGRLVCLDLLPPAP
ncbi:MAG: PQQ-like beta-propeller repeat protein [Pirellulales bacterium]|nr:PQQ-like beta-propeller repeat protein [Pirellulales bacterium]